MTQSPTLSNQGMFTHFSLTRVLRTSDLNYNNLFTALNTMRSAFEHETLAVVEKTQQVNGGRVMQVNILKAVLLTNTLYEDSKTANLGVVPFIREIMTADSFFIPEDRFTKSLAKIAPTQTRVGGDMTVVGAGGLLTIGVPFVDATFNSSIPFTSTNGNAGTVQYPVLAAGSTVTVGYITQAFHPTIVITRQGVTVNRPALVIANDTIGVVMNPILAGLLGLTLPSY